MVEKGMVLAKQFTKHCPHCRNKRKITSTQLMSEIIKDQLIPCSPFTHIGIDNIGPFCVKGMAKQMITIEGEQNAHCLPNTRAVLL